MGRTLALQAIGNQALDGYLAEPEGHARGNLVVVQEIFGVNAHIRDVCDGFAREGFRALAPAVFDRIERGVELGYDNDGVQRGVALAGQLTPETLLADVRAALDGLALLGDEPTGIVGYCLGGSVAWRAADALPVRAAVSYYGGMVPKLLELAPKCPVLAHFGELDGSIPLAGVEALRARHPEVTVETYPAGHGFNCDHRAAYDAPSAALALARTLAFFRTHLV